MNKEEQLLEKRLIELSNLAFSRDIVTFSDFLNLNELNILHRTPKDQFKARFETYGGYELAERQMVAFLPDALYYDYGYPMQALKICPVNKRFAEDLTHRDYLGAIMNLGTSRTKIGDIIQTDDIMKNLTRIRHTTITVERRELSDISYEPHFEELKGTVPSVRLDTVLSVAYPLSRSKLTTYIEAAKVFVNGKLITNNGYHLNEGDLISVRGLGRIAYAGILSFESERTFINYGFNKITWQTLYFSNITCISWCMVRSVHKNFSCGSSKRAGSFYSDQKCVSV